MSVFNQIANLEKPVQLKSPFGFVPPFRAVITGASGTGKTTWLIAYLNGNFSQFDQIIWITPKSSMGQPKFQLLRDKWGKYINFLSLDEMDRIDALIDHGFASGWQTCAVIDDYITESKHPFIAKLFTSGRHKNVSIFELLQSIFPEGSRVHRLNTDVFVIFRFGAQSEFRTLLNQVTSEKALATEANAIYKRILEFKPNGCFILDLKSRSTKQLPLRCRDSWIDVLIPSLYNL